MMSAKGVYLGMDHYFFKWGGEGLGFSSKIPLQQNLLKKIVQGEPWGEKYPASALCYQGSEFEK